MSDDMPRNRNLFSQEAEQSVLGAIILDNSILDDVACILSLEDFYFPQHQELYRVMSSLSGEPFDVVTLAERADDSVCSLDYLVDLARNTPSTSNALAYAEIVKQRKVERDLCQCANDIKSLCMDDTLTHQDRIERSQIAFTAISSEKQATTQVGMKESLSAVIDSLQRRFDGIEDANNVKTGYSDVDKRIQGYRPGNLILVGARPGMGKTTFATGVAKHAAMKNGKVMIFSLEMPHQELTQRLIASVGKCDMNVIRNPKGASDEFWPKLTVGTAILKELPIVIDDQGGLSVVELASRARREHRKSQIKLIVIDYIQLLNSGNKKTSDNRNLEVGAISMALKNLAKELSCPVIALSQLNRELEKRSDKRPQPSDLRDSGSLEQDADIIQFLYREEVYDPNTTFKGLIEINTAKFRDGKPGVDRALFEGKYNLITDLDASMYSQQEQENNRNGFSY